MSTIYICVYMIYTLYNRDHYNCMHREILGNIFTHYLYQHKLKTNNIHNNRYNKNQSK